MRRILFALLLALCCPQLMLAQQTFTARVVDAETGEPVPYVTIGTMKGAALLSNEEGAFTLVADSADEVFLSRVGYEKLMLRVGRIGPTVRIRPMVKSLAEVVVLPYSTDDILERCIENLKNDYKKGRKRDRLYFSRTIMVDEEGSEMLEAFMRSNSVVNLRNPRLVSGIVSKDRMAGLTLRSTNVHRLMELAPMVYKSSFWEKTLLPLNDWKRYKSCYDVTYSTLTARDGSLIYKFDLFYTGSLPRHWKGHDTALDGSLYISAKDFRLLSFDGEIANLRLRLRQSRRNMPASLKTHIDYQYENGYAEVSTLSMQGQSEGMKYRTILFNVPDSGFNSEDRVWVGENLVRAIRDAGVDSTLWKSTGIIQRTESEEQLAFGMPAQLFREEERTDSIAQAKGDDIEAMRFLRRRLKQFGMMYAQEKVYLHMDNTSYFLGDTIWFAAYTRQTKNGRPSGISKVLYVELLNNDGYLVERKAIEMSDGWSNGFFALTQPMMYSGFYELRAYTRWQLNWGITEHPHSRAARNWFLSSSFERDYYRDYEKLYSRVFPVYDKPANQENPERNMTSRIMRRYYKKDMDAEERQPQLTLYPEGGHLVAGIPNRVAFEAAMSDGEWLEGTLSVDGQTIPTQNRGRGVFTIKPQKGMELEATFTAKDGQKVSARLPKPEEVGVALSVRQQGEEWTIDVQTTGGLSPDSMALSVMHEGRLEEFRLLRHSPFKLYSQNSSAGKAGAPGVRIGPGIHQVTVFDSRGRVWADRLFFASAPDLAMPTLKVSGLKDEYEPYEEISLKLKADHIPELYGALKRYGYSFVSLAVRDGYQQEQLYDNGNIQTEMLLASEVRGFIPNPGWYFEQDDEEHRQALDLLMMTQGWRRFDWREMAVPGTFNFTQPAEQQPIVQGTVYRGGDPSAAHNEILLQRLSDTENHAIEELMNRPEKKTLVDLKPITAIDKMHLEHKNAADADETGQTGGGSSVQPIQDLDAARSIRQLYSPSSNLKHEVKVHLEFKGAGDTLTYQLETNTQGGHFQVELPRFYGTSELHLSAADTTKWKAGEEHAWVVPQSYYVPDPRHPNEYVTTEYPEFYIKVSAPYPRFVKPYSYYQSQTSSLSATMPKKGANSRRKGDSSTLREVPVEGRQRNGMRRFDQSQPAFIIDAQEMENMVYDAGVFTRNEAERFARTLLGDYGLDWPYASPTQTDISLLQSGDIPSRIYKVYGIPPGSSSYSLPDGRPVPQDSVYSSKYIQTYGRNYDQRNFEYTYLPPGLDKYVVYTDYCPRLEGSKRYRGSNLPETRIAVFPRDDKSERPVFRDRYFHQPGFSYTAKFYSPNYSKQTPPEPTDYRRTLYWNPSLQLDEKGEARVILWNNSRTTHPQVEAAGQASDGTLLWNKQ
ncbi:MAG: hypothetical protein IJR87_12000 [Bacteroidaceae bacterium]|nr:hypothetical protein [Bacteroidaceae bacterium]